MFIKLILIILISSLSSCSLISVTQKHYKRDDGPAPKEKLLTFDSQQALETGATLNNAVAAGVYYEGTAAKSPEAKILWDMSYRFMDFLGVNNNFDLTDPEALKKTFDAVDKASAEKDRNIADLKQEVDDYRTRKEGDAKIIRDKDEEMKAQDGKWSAKFGSLFYGFIALLILIPVAAIVIQVTTGVPLASGLFTGALKTFGKLAKQTVVGIDKFKEDLVKAKEAADATPEEKEAADKWLGKMRNTLSKHHDQDVKDYVDKFKKRM